MKNIRWAVAFMAMAFVFAATFSTAACASNSPLRHEGAVYPANLLQAAAAAAQQQITPEHYYHQVWELVEQNFLYRSRLKDWDKWEHKYDGKLSSFADAEKAINEMLDTLKDPYTYFKNATMTKAQGTRNAQRNVVSHRMLPGNIGYIRIQTFSSNHTAEEVRDALKALSGADAYVLDLRDNGGGYIREALAVFSMFVDKGTFTVMKGQYQGKPYEEKIVVTATAVENTENGTLTRSSREPNLAGNKPLIVLVNGDSASASEMLSGALRDNGRAELLGTKTFGKGIAQITWDLPRGTSVRITFAAYYLPGGTSVHGPGITPDHVVSPSWTGDSQLSEATRQLDKKLGR